MSKLYFAPIAALSAVLIAGCGGREDQKSIETPKQETRKQEEVVSPEEKAERERTANKQGNDMLANYDGIFPGIRQIDELDGKDGVIQVPTAKKHALILFDINKNRLLDGNEISSFSEKVEAFKLRAMKNHYGDYYYVPDRIRLTIGNYQQALFEAQRDWIQREMKKVDDAPKAEAVDK